MDAALPDFAVFDTETTGLYPDRGDRALELAVLRLRPDGSAVEQFATGLRNSVGFDWAPWSGELFATDNGRDLLGDDVPGI